MRTQLFALIFAIILNSIVAWPWQRIKTMENGGQMTVEKRQFTDYYELPTLDTEFDTEFLSEEELEDLYNETQQLLLQLSSEECSKCYGVCFLQCFFIYFFIIKACFCLQEGTDENLKCLQLDPRGRLNSVIAACPD